MRTIDEKKLEAIRAKAQELLSLVKAENCRIIGDMSSDCWDCELCIVPNEVEMGEQGAVKDGSDERFDPIDDTPETIGLSVTLLDNSLNSLYEEDECDCNVL